jgi:curved DNA-binding protein CbpA
MLHSKKEQVNHKEA